MKTPLRAILSETLRFHDLNGRSARGAYLWFFLFWNAVMALGLIAIAKIAPEGSGLWLSIALLLGLSAFVAPAGIRRLHDTGQSGGSLFNMFVPSMTFTVVVWLVLTLFEKSVLFGVPAASVTLGETGFLLSILFVLIGYFVIPIGLAIGAGITLFLTFAHISHTLGQLILPSQPDTNQYGPNPNEVPS
ncbi:DUF805 domain-containing protein [Octadecabacter sp. CECT 8868]|uniref:DUF805 domain-containing protein n=1 Tax=Octadecabacter algicola TaxID=2909342 RepID=UPI001F432D5D|nr:DUF805 domain-containing protein [Octadecabacter algicola]MCF2906611.1 DUF805 domain-containing protein [Octadecabacter algicola]